MPSTSASPEVQTPGRYNDGKVAVTRDVALHLTNRTLFVVGPAGEALAAWPLEEVQLASQEFGLARIVRTGTDERLALRDPVLIAALAAGCINWKRGRGGAPWSLFAWVAGAVASVVAFFWLLLPVLSEQIAAVIPADLERRFGLSLVQQVEKFALARGGKACTSVAGITALHKLSSRVAAADERRLEPLVLVVDLPYINAFAFPGGRIIVLRGLLDFMQNPNELAGVMGHEFAHSDLRHPTAMAIKSGAAGFTVGLLFGDIVGVSALAIVGQTLLSAAYSREAEEAADMRGLESLRRAGLDSRPLGDFFQRLEAKNTGLPAGLSLLDTHPASTGRALVARTASPRGDTVLSPAEWAAVKAICR